jgi:hypothetical protein
LGWRRREQERTKEWLLLASRGDGNERDEARAELYPARAGRPPVWRLAAADKEEEDSTCKKKEDWRRKRKDNGKIKGKGKNRGKEK